MRWRVELTGRAAHSSMPHYGVNAIAYAGRLIGEIAAHGGGAEGRGRSTRASIRPGPALQVTADRGRHGLQHRAGAVLVRLGDPRAAGLRSARAAAAPATRSPPRTACPRCASWRRRPASRSRHRNQVSAFAADARSGIVPLTLKLAGQNETFAVSYATEAGLFQDGGAPSIVCGPGDIAQAHTANEFIAHRGTGEVPRLPRPRWRTGRRREHCGPSPVSRGEGSRHARHLPRALVRGRERAVG